MVNFSGGEVDSLVQHQIMDDNDLQETEATRQQISKVYLNKFYRITLSMNHTISNRGPVRGKIHSSPWHKPVALTELELASD